jgi:glucokinase
MTNMQIKTSAQHLPAASLREFHGAKSTGANSTNAKPQLVADIGGTNARFGLIEYEGARVSNVRSMRCADFATPADAVLAYLADQRVAEIPTVAAFALAVAIDDGPLKLTNGSWIFKRDELRVSLGLEQLKFLNDFEALAFGLPDLAVGDYLQLKTIKRDGETIESPDAAFNRDHLIAVIGPGTGLGVGAVAPTAHGWIALPAEGGHVTLAANDDLESELLRIARQSLPHVSAERFLSGLGMPFLYRTLAVVRGEVANPNYEAHDITREATENKDALCLATLDVFCAMLGSFAGNAALTLGAKGGVFIGGGVVPKLGEFFLQSKFRERFVAKGRYQGYLEKIATALITSTDVALNGAAKSIAQKA